MSLQWLVFGVIIGVPILATGMGTKVYICNNPYPKVPNYSYLKDLVEFKPDPAIKSVRKQLNEWIFWRRKLRHRCHAEIMAQVACWICGVMLMLVTMPIWAWW